MTWFETFYARWTFWPRCWTMRQCSLRMTTTTQPWPWKTALSVSHLDFSWYGRDSSCVAHWWNISTGKLKGQYPWQIICVYLMRRTGSNIYWSIFQVLKHHCQPWPHLPQRGSCSKCRRSHSRAVMSPCPGDCLIWKQLFTLPSTASFAKHCSMSQRHSGSLL